MEVALLVSQFLISFINSVISKFRINCVRIISNESNPVQFVDALKNVALASRSVSRLHLCLFKLPLLKTLEKRN